MKKKEKKKILILIILIILIVLSFIIFKIIPRKEYLIKNIDIDETNNINQINIEIKKNVKKELNCKLNFIIKKNEINLFNQTDNIILKYEINNISKEIPIFEGNTSFDINLRCD